MPGRREERRRTQKQSRKTGRLRQGKAGEMLRRYLWKVTVRCHVATWGLSDVDERVLSSCRGRSGYSYFSKNAC